MSGKAAHAVMLQIEHLLYPGTNYPHGHDMVVILRGDTQSYLFALPNNHQII